MISWFLNYLKTRALTIHGASGFVSSGQGMAGSDEGVVSVFVGSLLGAFCGLLGGFVLSHLCRYLTYVTGRQFGGFRWVIIGAVAGAVIFGCLAAFRDDS
jgi:hypothetical protein